MMTNAEKTAVMTFAVAYVATADAWEGANAVGFDEDDQATKDWRAAEAASKEALFAWQDDFNRVGFELSGCVDDNHGVTHEMEEMFPGITSDSEYCQMWLYGSEAELTKVKAELETRYPDEVFYMGQQDREFFYPSGICNWTSARKYVENNS